MKYSELEYIEFPEECMFAEPIVAYSRDAHNRSIHKRVVQRLVIFGLLNCLLESEDFGLEWNALQSLTRWFGAINGNHRQNGKTQV